MQQKAATKHSMAAARRSGTRQIEIKIVWTLPPGRVNNLQRPDSEQAKTGETPALTQNDAYSESGRTSGTQYE